MSTKETWTIGDVVQKLRMDQGITLQELSCGLCSAATLSRIEADERDMDMMTAEIVFGRLGYAADKFEIYTGTEELERYHLRERMTGEIQEGALGSLEEDLRQYYERYGERLSPLEEQFLKGTKGFWAWKTGDLEEAERFTEEAVQITIPSVEEEWGGRMVLSEWEMELLVMQADIYQEKGKEKDAFLINNRIFRYLDFNDRRKEQMTDLYVRVAEKLMSVYLESRETQRACEVCRKSLDLMKKTKKLRGLAEMMEWKGACEERLEQERCLSLGTSKSSYVKAYYLYLTMGNQKNAERVKVHMEELGQWESMR